MLKLRCGERPVIVGLDNLPLFSALDPYASAMFTLTVWFAGLDFSDFIDASSLHTCELDLIFSGS
jgi:hypothetical protein